MPIYIGTSGFNYPHWRGLFYPQKLSPTKWLDHYVRYFDTVELNVTFYRLPTEAAFKSWDDRTPKKFVFALKGSRFITHLKQLGDVREPLKIFFQRARPLAKKTGVILWQLPPRFKLNMEKLERFLKLLKPYSDRRHAFEFRHPSWFEDPAASKLIKSHRAAPCDADWPSVAKLSFPHPRTFLYIRRHGIGARYAGCYSDAQLKADAKYIGEFGKGKTVFVYFNNDAEGYAVKNALRLKELLS